MKFLRTASIAFLASSLSFMAGSSALASVTTQLQSGLKTAAGPSYAGTSTNLPEIAGRIINVLLTLLGVLLLAYLLWGGFTWMTAAGDEGKVKKARGVIRDAIIGLFIIVASFAIASFVLDRLTEVATGVATQQ